MSTLPAGTGPSEVRAARAAARRRPSGLGPALLMLGACAASAAAVFLFAELDYSFGQAPHRLLKVVVGVTAMAAMALRPKIGLLLLPIAVPFLGWMPKLPLPGFNMLNLLLLGVFTFWVLTRLPGRLPLLRRTSLTFPIALFAGVCALGVVRGAAVPAGGRYDVVFWSLWLWRSLAPFLVYFIAAAMLQDEKDQRRMAWAILLGFMLEAIVTIKLGRSGRGGRAVGSFAQSNELGAYLAMFTPMCLALLPAARSWLGRAAMAVGIGLGLWAEFLTLSRGGYLAMAVALLFVALRTSRVVGVIVALAVVTSPAWVPRYVVDRVLYTTRTVAGTDEVELEGSSQLRINTWKAMLQVIADHPVDGVGFGGLGYVLPELGEELNSEVKDTAHNTFLRVQAELGALGSLALVFLLGRCWLFGEHGRRRAQNVFQRQVSVGFQGALVALALACFFGDRFFSVFVVGNFWGLAALVEHYRVAGDEVAA
jgi:O-antigen ligase